MSNESNSGQATTVPSGQEQENLDSGRRFKMPFILALVLQMAILAALGGFNMYVLAAGHTVLLKTIPIDPNDVFRGDYLALNYEISTIKGTNQFELGKQVFVVLEKHDPYWSVSYMSDKLPELKGDQVALKGKIDYFLDGKTHVHYGLEQYYVPEGKGTLPPHTTPDIELAVDRFGNATIKQLVLHGKKMNL